MHEIQPGLFVGDEHDCRQASPDTAVVHACKTPCHQHAIGYQGSLPTNHPNYLILEDDTDLYLNIVDMNRQQKHEFMDPITTAALNFIDTHHDQHDVLIHCNQGRSRAPTIAMLYLAKRENAIPDSNYAETRPAFDEIYPGYVPGRGLDLYLRERWADIDK